jgi:ABC-2 type transport system permease protein
MIFSGQRLHRWRAVARIEILQLIHERPTLAIILLVPALQILLFGYAVHFDPREVPIAIARDHAEPEGSLIRAIAETKLFQVLGDGLPQRAAIDLLAQHRALIAIEFPRSEDDSGVASSEQIEALIDGSDPETARPAVVALEANLLHHLAEAGPLGRLSRFKVTWLYNPDGQTSWSIIPALSGVIVMISMLLLGALTLVRERERGTWESLLTTPVSGVDAMVGKLAPYLVLGVLQGTIVVLLGHGLFGMPLRGSFTPFMLATAVLALAYLSLGFGISAVAQTQVQAIQAAVIFYLPSMLLSGFLFPFSGMPRWAQWLGETLPLTHFVRAMRGLLLRGDGMDSVLREMWPAAAFMCLAATLAVSQYRRRLG